jgi:predicted RNase H-related nuclease YkuK (DUF458 family)
MEWVRVHTGADFHIGTDSIQKGKDTKFITVIIAYTRGRGGAMLFSKAIEPRINSMRERLSKEVWKSVDLAMNLIDYLGQDVKIHVDCSLGAKNKSSQYAKELAGLVEAQGFTALLKPDSWASTSAADHIARFGVTRGREI